MNIADLDLISTKEAAAILGISKIRLYQLIKSYQLPHKLVGNMMIFLRNDIENFQVARQDKLKHRRKDKQNKP